MEKNEVYQIYEQLNKLSDEYKIKVLEDHIKRTDLDKLSLAMLCELLGKISFKVKKTGVEYFEKAGSLLEDYWSFSHFNLKISKSSQRKILLRALKNYKISLSFYDSAGYKVSENRVLRRIRDIEHQLKNYNSPYRKLIILFIFVSFLSSITLFSYNLTGFSITNSDAEQSFFIGGILLFLAIIGVIYIIFFGFFYYSSVTLLKNYFKRKVL